MAASRRSPNSRRSAALRVGHVCGLASVIGPAVAPFNAFLIAQGIETLSLRVERHVANAQKVAEWLAAHDQVRSVSYAGLPDHPSYERARRYL